MNLSLPDKIEARAPEKNNLFSSLTSYVTSYTAYDIYQSLKQDLHHFNANKKKYVNIINDIRLLYFRASAFKEGGSEAFKGGQVMIDDSKMYYKHWLSLLKKEDVDGGSRKKLSSHQSDDEQFEVLLPNRWGNILFGTRKGGTWFQTEAYGFTRSSKTYQGMKDSIGHISTTVQYYSTFKTQQVGTCGYSPHTESNPLRLGKNSVPKKPY